MNIKVYTGPHCFKCSELKEFLAENKISYTEYDINDTVELAKEIVTASGYQTLPIIKIDEEWYSGLGDHVRNKLLNNKEE